jgi:hypothetical protein
MSLAPEYQGARPRSRPGSLMIQGRSLETIQHQQTLQLLKIAQQLKKIKQLKVIQRPCLKQTLHLGCYTPERVQV